MPHKTIIQRIQSGDESALKEIYVEFRQEFISWLVKNWNCDLADAKDVFQLSVIILYENIASGKLHKLKSSLRTYLFGIGKNKIRELKRQQVKINLDADTELMKLIAKPEEESTERFKHEVLVVNQALTKLGNPCKQLLELYYFYNLKMEAIKERMQYNNANTVKNMKYKCMKRLQPLIEKAFSNADC